MLSFTDFDARFGTDTDGEIATELLAQPAALESQAVSYEATDPLAFRHMIGALPIDPSRYAFVDLGSGKGRVVLLAAARGFAQVVGVESSPLLHATAQDNLREWARRGNETRHLELRHDDAASVVLPARPTVLYLFNPFHARVMARLLLNVRSSLRSHPRVLWVVYYNPQLGYMLQAVHWLAKVTAGRGFQQGDYGVWRTWGELAGQGPSRGNRP